MLEPYEGKLSRTVLRGEGGSNTADLPDHSKNPEEVINRFKESLERFIILEEKVLADEINLDNVRSIWDNEEFEWSSGNRTPLDLYDYELTC